MPSLGPDYYKNLPSFDRQCINEALDELLDLENGSGKPSPDESAIDKEAERAASLEEDLEA